MALPMAVYFHRITVFALPVNMLILPLLGVLLPAALALRAADRGEVGVTTAARHHEAGPSGRGR